LAAFVVIFLRAVVPELWQFLAVVGVMVVTAFFLMAPLRSVSRIDQSLADDHDQEGGMNMSAAAASAKDKYVDPVRWSFLPSQGILGANTTQPVESENDIAALKFIVLHRPTHDVRREARGDYPYSWHFSGRKRLWEVRVQVRLKVKPDGPIYFGLEMEHVPGHKKSRAVQHTQRLVLAAIRAAIGKEFYQTPGDDIGDGSQEAEPPTFAMPLWALDQFVISEIGEEPDLAGDLNGVGMRRTQGMKGYIGAMRELVDGFATDKVYTFCFWGISQAVDVINWELRGVLPGVRMDANKLCGVAPLYVVAYILPPAENDETRHLISRKKYFFKVALWSDKKPPAQQSLDKLLGLGIEQDAAEQKQRGRRRRGVKDLLRCWHTKLIPCAA